MFSGIVEELGVVKSVSASAKGKVLSVRADAAAQDIKIGDSVAVNGACLTVVKIDKNILNFDLLSETSRLTNLGKLRIADKVNLERALKIGDRLSGHFVTGHIDCKGIIRRKGYAKGNLAFDIAVPEKFVNHILPKGSIAVDGISLTVAEKKGSLFSVYIIPHTLKNTTLGLKSASAEVNIEFDILAKK